MSLPGVSRQKGIATNKLHAEALVRSGCYCRMGEATLSIAGPWSQSRGASARVVVAMGFGIGSLMWHLNGERDQHSPMAR